MDRLTTHHPRSIPDMHTLVFALVDAVAPDDALTAARTAFDRLVGFGPDATRRIAYYHTFDEVDRAPSIDPDRVGDLPRAAPVDDRAGRALLERAWHETERARRRRLQRLRDVLATHDDAAILRNADGARQRFDRTLATPAPATALYDEYSDPIQDRDRLGAVLDAQERSWIVPAVARVEPR